MIFRNSYVKIISEGFEPTTTEFRSDALSNSAIFQCSDFIWLIAFVSHHINYNWNIVLVIT